MTPSVAFHSQPFGKARAAGTILQAMLDDHGLDAITIAVAWARFRGLLRIKSNVKAFRKRGGHLRVVLGVDEGGATRPGLLGAMRMADEAYVFKDERGGTFHPKVYLGEGERKAELFVGSSNLTPGGLFVNVEASTAVTFERPAEDKHPALCDARLFIAGLIDDHEACTRLTQTTVEDLCANRSYRVAPNERPQSRKHARPRGADPGDVDETVDRAGRGEAKSLFSPSQRRRARVPSLTQADREELAALEADDRQEPEQPTTPLSSGGVVPPGAPASSGLSAPVSSTSITVTDVWTKKMGRTDALQVSGSTHDVGGVRFTTRGHNVDRGWFRRTLFRAPVRWKRTTDSRSNRIEQAEVRFDVRIEGVAYGTHDLKVDHGRHREANQHNVLTVLHWGPVLGKVLRDRDRSGRMLTVERVEDGSYRLTID